MLNFRSYKCLFIVCLCVAFIHQEAKAQNVSSAYSEYGIGDIDTRDYNRYFSQGGTDISRRDPAAYNLGNPASLTALPLKVVNYDIATSGRISNYQNPGQDTSLGTSKDFVIKRIALSFKPSGTTGIAIGFRPFSTVSYLNSTITRDPNNIPVPTVTDGSGGINQVYFTYAKEFGKKKNFSFGGTAAYLFGSIQQSATTLIPSDQYEQLNVNTNSYDGAYLQLGLQYYTPAASTSKWIQSIGLTVTVYTKLTGQYIANQRTDSENLAVIPSTTTVSNESFSMPYSVGFGYSVKHNNITYAADFNYYGWPKQSVANQGLTTPNTFTTPAYKFSAGIEYSILGHRTFSLTSYTYEKYFIGIGASAQNSYLFYNGNYIKEYAGSFGGGVNVNSSLTVYAGLEFGVKGDNTLQQIKENFTNISFGITFKNFWRGTKKYGRFP